MKREMQRVDYLAVRTDDREDMIWIEVQDEVGDEHEIVISAKQVPTLREWLDEAAAEINARELNVIGAPQH